MKTIPTALAAHYASGTTTLADLLKITRKDGQVFAFTSASTDVTISGQLYTSAQGLDISSLEVTAGLAVDNLELTTLDDGTIFSRVEVLAGVWRNADFVISRYNWANPADGVEVRMVGTVGEVHLKRGSITAELRGLQQYLQQPIGSVSSKTCRARLGDSLCRVNMAGFTHNYTVGNVISRQNFSPILGGDAFYSQTSLALHFDGANGSATYTDSSANSLTPSATGGAFSLSTTQSKFGGASVYFPPGVFCSITYASSALFGTGTGDFTAECWCYRTGNTSGGTYASLFSIGFAQPWALYLNSTGAIGISFSGALPSVYSSSPLSLNAWDHVALVRSGNVWQIYKNGVSFLSVTNSINCGTSRQLIVGEPGASIESIRGYVDEFRFTKGVARYTGNFTPPTEAFDVQAQYVVGGARPDNYFAEGLLTFTSGANTAITQKVKSSSVDGYLSTSLPFLSEVAIGDTYTITAGCQKRLSDCSGKFANAINFQGEPHLPGIDAVTS